MSVSTSQDDQTLRAALVVASDIHLRHMDDERGQLLLDVLARLETSVEYLVLNGDIFDFCFGDSAYFRRKFEALGAALAALARRGPRVIFVEGNHEFHLERIGWDGVEIVQDRDLELRLRSGEVVKLTHGDLIGDDPWYRAFRGLVKSGFARHCAKLLPGSWLDAYALKHARVSRSRDRYRRLDHARILGDFERWLVDGADRDAASERARHGIMGHFHVPYAEPRVGSDGLLLSVESWDRPNLLIFESGEFRRIYLRTPGAPFHKEPIKPLVRSR